MRLYIIRHADPDYANNTITPAGHKEAQALAQRLRSYRLKYVYSSPLGRALDTMRYTAELLKAPPSVEEWTQELAKLRITDATWGAMAAWDVPGELIRDGEEYPGESTWHRSRPFDDPIFREQFETLKESSDAFIGRHGYRREGRRYRCVTPNRDAIAVFCHGGFALTWLAHLLDLPVPLVWSGFWLPPSSVTTILWDERSPAWAIPRCIGLGDVSHLYAAGLPVRPRGIIANFD